MLYKKYPFIKSYEEALRDSTGAVIPFKDLMRDSELVERARRSILNSIKQGVWEGSGYSVEEEIMVFYLSLSIVKGVGDPTISSRFLRAVREAIKRLVEKEDARTLTSLLALAGLEPREAKERMEWLVDVKNGRVYMKELIVAVPLNRYLSVIAVSDEALLHPSNSFIKNGVVYLDLPRLKSLASLVLIELAEKRLHEVEPAPHELISNIAGEIRDLIAARVRPENIPACIRELEHRVASGSELRDDEIYTIITFYYSIKAPKDRVKQVLAMLTRGDERLAESILRAVMLETGGYAPFTCEELKRRGICTCTDDLINEYYSTLNKRKNKK